MRGAAEAGETARGVTFDGEKPESIEAVCTPAQLRQGVVIRRGKKVFHKVIAE